MVKALHHVAINVTDVPRAIHFYESVFGLKQIDRGNAGEATPTGAWFDAAGVQIHLQGRPPVATKTDQHFAFEVASLDGLAEKVAAAGGRYEEVRPLPGYRFRGNAWDPDNNRIELLAR